VSDRALEAGVARRWALWTVVALIYAFLLGPILIIVLTSFTATTSTAFPPQGFSLRWYGAFFRADNFVDAFWFSIKLASMAAPIATAIGFLSAYSIIRFGGRRRELSQSMSLLPAMVPHILISMSLLLALNFVPLPGFGALLAGHVLICLPFAIAGVTASLDGVDAHLETAALTLGASRVRALWEIVLPLTAPGIVSALIFTFIISFGDVYIALFLSGPGMTTLPIEIYSQIQWESTPVISAITSLQILLILVLGLIVERLVGMRRIMRM
jgi:putative spermidine/putrescine transport system permease protein